MRKASLHQEDRTEERDRRARQRQGPAEGAAAEKRQALRIQECHGLLQELLPSF